MARFYGLKDVAREVPVAVVQPSRKRMSGDEMLRN